MGKKFKTFEDATAAMETAKSGRKAAREALKQFEVDNKLKHREDHSGDKKLGKQWSKLNDALQAQITAFEDAETASKELKPAKERESKYDYPADVTTAEQKKKYRTTQRAAAKKAEKEAAVPKKDKAEKKAEKTPEAAPATEAPKKKKVKKSTED